MNWNARDFWSRTGEKFFAFLAFPKEALTVLQIFRSVVDDPVARCARSAPAPPSQLPPGEADSIGRPDRPSSIDRPEPEITKMESATSTIAAAPRRRPEQVGSVGIAPPSLARARDHSQQC